MLKNIGVELVDEQIIPTVLTDATSQLLNMKKKTQTLPISIPIHSGSRWC